MLAQHCLYCDVYVWFMNMASWYSNAAYKKRLKYLDFLMIFHFQKNKKNKLKNLFSANNEFWENAKKLEKVETYKDTPPWFCLFSNGFVMD